jgi:hypothetical protein
VASIGLDPAKFGTHSLRRTKAVLIYGRTGNLLAVQLLPGHSKSEAGAIKNADWAPYHEICI